MILQMFFAALPLDDLRVGIESRALVRVWRVPSAAGDVALSDRITHLLTLSFCTAIATKYILPSIAFKTSRQDVL